MVVGERQFSGSSGAVWVTTRNIVSGRLIRISAAMRRRLLLFEGPNLGVSLKK